MAMDTMQRAWLRAALAGGSWFGERPTSQGHTLDRMATAFLRLWRQRRGDGRTEVAELRRLYEQSPKLLGLRPDRTVRAEAMLAGGIPARRYTPAGTTRGDMLYFHGGGFCSGSLETHDALCRVLAARAGLRIVSVQYRLAPEHRFPAAYEDASAAWAWAQRQGGPPWLIGGDSAGANLAAVQALGGAARLQVLLYPVVDLVYQEGLYPSIDELQDGYILSRVFMEDCLDMLLPPGQDPGDGRLSPIRADLSRASPALIVVAGFDPLRDQGLAYAAALQKAGVRTHLIEEHGLLHGFADTAGVVPTGRRAVNDIADWIRAELRE